jgi:hypothetical protein
MRAPKRFIGIAAMLAAAVPAVGAANAGAADDYRHLGTLSVHQSEDWGSGGDEPFITVNGREVWDAGGEMDEPSSATINLDVRIGSTVRVYDRDSGNNGDPHDLIGSFPVEGWGTVHLTNDDAHYTIDVQR